MRETDTDAAESDSGPPRGAYTHRDGASEDAAGTTVTGEEISRRGFLSASGVAVTLSVAGTGDPTVTTAPLDEIVLRRADLVEPNEGYTDRSGSPADAALVRHLRTAVSGFSEEAVSLSAFVTTPSARTPTHVETAAIARQGGWDPNELVRATDDWLRGVERPATAVSVTNSVGPRRVQWESRTSDGTLDVSRLFVTRPGPVLLTVAHGDTDARLGPDAAVERYEETMAARLVPE
jgi:hypothetical protein